MVLRWQAMVDLTNRILEYIPTGGELTDKSWADSGDLTVLLSGRLILWEWVAKLSRVN